MTTLTTTTPPPPGAFPASLASRPPGGEAGGPPTLGEIVAMLRRRTVLIVALFALLCAATISVFLVWRVYFPGYRAECLIECISNIPDTELTAELERLKQEEHERFVMTQSLLIKSPGTLGEALKLNTVRETQWYKAVKSNDHLLQLTDDLSAVPVRGTNFLRVAMTCRNKKDPALIVNEVVRLWEDSVRKRSAEEFALKALEDAQDEAKALDRQIEEKRNELKKLAARLPAGASLNPGNNITAQQVAQFGEQVAQLTLELSQLEQYRQIYNDPTGVAVTAEDRALVEQDLQVAELARSVFLLEQQLAADARVYGAEHKVVRQLEAQLGAGNEKLAALRAEKLQQRRNDAREAVNTAYANSQHALFLAQENLARAEAELQDQDQLLFNYRNLEAELLKESEYRTQLEAYIKGRSRVIRQQTAIRVNVAQPAIDPLEISSPSVLVVPLGVFLSLAISIGLALGLELIDKSVRTPQDILRHLDIALLGAVPDTDDEEVPIERVETAVWDSPRSMVAEAFRRIRTNLQFSAPPERQRTVLIASPRPEDGKTTVACNLAIAGAQGGKRVLLIDANFRRPSLHKMFPKAQGKGLSHILVGEGSLAAGVTQTHVPRLDVLGAGRVPPNPGELLGSDAFRALLAQAAAQYDQVFLDTAPALLTSDAAVVATAVDGVVLVVRAKSDSRGEARRACNLLADVGARLLGAVLNAAQVTRGGYFREQLRAYYDYQSEADGGGAIQPTRSPDPGST
ncbi:MAG: polysaccharide biosynthesis tyrosine autokinase [Planctomycetes bacterium]|nr:polysaccharide biosynthesis tyrosine autokinase [Planctomycetota bacterium]